jgi:hypothetical protein
MPFHSDAPDALEIAAQVVAAATTRKNTFIGLLLPKNRNDPSIRQNEINPANPFHRIGGHNPFMCPFRLRGYDPNNQQIAID